MKKHITDIKQVIVKLFFKRTFRIFFSFLLPFAIWFLVLNLLNIAPFGNISIAFSDANVSYLHFVSELIRDIKSGKNIFYSFSKGLGGNFWSIIAYYLLNPFYLLFLFADITSYPEIFAISIILQCSICGTTMYLFLSHIFEDKPYLILFSTIYSLCGYLTSFFINAMWLNGVLVLPLIALGIYEIVENNKCGIYFLSLLYAILTNFYIGFMLCIFSFLYFLYLSFIYDKFRKKAFFLFFFSSICAGLTCSFVWFPTILSLRTGRIAQISSNDFSLVENMPFLDIFIKFFPGTTDSNQLNPEGLPNIYSTIFVVYLVYIFFRNPNFKIREKIGTATLLLIYFLSFHLRFLSSIFQGFSHTNWFNFRYSFILSFILIIIAVKEFSNIHNTPQKLFKEGLLFIIGLTIITFRKTISFASPVANYFELTVILFFSLVFVYPTWSQKFKNIKNYALIICIVPSLLINTFLNLKKTIINNPNTKEMTAYIQAVFPTSTIIDGIKIHDTSFYRCETEYLYYNTPSAAPSLYGNYGFSSFSSTESETVLRGLTRFGVQKFDMRSFYSCNTPVAMESFLGLKYILSLNDISEEKGYEFPGSPLGINIFKNQFALSLANIANEDITEIDYAKGNIFELQNKVWKSLTNKNDNIYSKVINVSFSEKPIDSIDSISLENATNHIPQYLENGFPQKTEKTVFSNPELLLDRNIPLPSDTVEVTFSFTAQKDGPIYLFNENFVNKTPLTKKRSFIYLGTFQKGEQVSDHFFLDKFVSENEFKEFISNIFIYYENRETFQEYVNEIRKNPVNLVLTDNNIVSGTFNVSSENNHVLLTIPYDEGWSLKIDDSPANIDKTLGIFMSFSVPEGEHSFRLEYIPVGFKLGAIVSILSGIIFMLFYLFQKTRFSSQNKE